MEILTAHPIPSLRQSLPLAVDHLIRWAGELTRYPRSLPAEARVAGAATYLAAVLPVIERLDSLTYPFDASSPLEASIFPTIDHLQFDLWNSTMEELETLIVPRVRTMLSVATHRIDEIINAYGSRGNANDDDRISRWISSAYLQIHNHAQAVSLQGRSSDDPEQADMAERYVAPLREFEQGLVALISRLPEQFNRLPSPTEFDWPYISQIFLDAESLESQSRQLNAAADVWISISEASAVYCAAYPGSDSVASKLERVIGELLDMGDIFHIRKEIYLKSSYLLDMSQERAHSDQLMNDYLSMIYSVLNRLRTGQNAMDSKRIWTHIRYSFDPESLPNLIVWMKFHRQYLSNLYADMTQSALRTPVELPQLAETLRSAIIEAQQEVSRILHLARKTPEYTAVVQEYADLMEQYLERLEGLLANVQSQPGFNSIIPLRPVSFKSVQLIAPRSDLELADPQSLQGVLRMVRYTLDSFISGLILARDSNAVMVRGIVPERLSVHLASFMVKVQDLPAYAPSDHRGAAAEGAKQVVEAVLSHWQQIRELIAQVVTTPPGERDFGYFYLPTVIPLSQELFDLVFMPSLRLELRLRGDILGDIAEAAIKLNRDKETVASRLRKEADMSQSYLPEPSAEEHVEVYREEMKGFIARLLELVARLS